MNNRQNKYRVALLGATGYIGRSLLATAPTELVIIPFSRNAEKGKTTLISYGIVMKDMQDYSDFLQKEFDIVINATGIGSPKKLTADPQAVFLVTEEMDNLLFQYLEKHPKTSVFNISSGSVKELIETGKTSDYSRAKYESEKRHRDRNDFAIIDLRVFAFISRWLDLEESFFISEVAKCLLNKETFVTNQNDMIRDYYSASDIWDVISFLQKLPPTNTVYDMQSRSPISKFELLTNLSKHLGLQYKITSDILNQSPTGAKNVYYSKSTALSELGFSPKKTSLENIEYELNKLLQLKGRVL